MQKYVHPLDVWNALSTEEQEKVIGRYKLSDIEMPDEIKPVNSHVAVNTIMEPDGTQRQIVRANMPFGEVGRGEFGTYYIAYSATPSVTERMLIRMFIGEPAGQHRPHPGFLHGRHRQPVLRAVGRLPGQPSRPARRNRSSRRLWSVRRRRRFPGFPRHRQLEEEHHMNNLHRELAPVSDAAWASIEDEARRTFERHVAGRRVVDVQGPDGPTLASVGTGHIAEIEPPGGDAAGILAWQRTAQQLVQLRVPFTLSRLDVDNVERGAQDSDWQPVKDAARQIAFAEDRAIFDGYPAAGITGVRASTSNPVLTLPAGALEYPTVISQAVSALRLAGVNGPYSLLLSAEAYTMVSETSDHGYPIREHLARVVDGEIIWAPAIDGAFLLSGRGGDYELRLGQDLSIGYLSHDSEFVQLYFQESLTFLAYTAEASVVLNAR